MNAKDAIKNIKEIASQSIKRFLISRSVDSLDFGEPYIFNCPPVVRGRELKNIAIYEGELIFTFDGEDGDVFLGVDNMFADEIAGIADWLEDTGTAECIDDYLKSVDPLHGEKKKFTFRFHAHSWVDISVMAYDQDEAFELADEIYNNGEYEENPENFENLDCEDITDCEDLD